MPPQLREFPDVWATEKLTQQFDYEFSNIVAVIMHLAPAYLTLRDVDSIYSEMVKALINPEGLIEAILLMKSHSAYRGACLLSMGGQTTESFMVARGALENALYALHINKNPGSTEVWLNRHHDDSSLRLSKSEFSYRKVISTLEAADAAGAEVVKNLYERTIDFGAHPNERASTSNMHIESHGEKKTIKQNYLAGGTLQQQHAMKTTAQVGICGLQMFRQIFKHRFDILGLTPKLDELSKNL